MTFIPAVTGTVDPNNSCTTLSGTTFTGTSTDVSRYASVTISVFSTAASTAGGCVVQFADDGVWYSDCTFSVVANVHFTRSVTVNARYFRIVYTSSISSPTIRIQTLLSLSDASNVVVLGSSSIPTDLVVPVTNSLVYGMAPNGTITPCNNTSDGLMEVEIHGPVLPFGSINTENLTAVFQVDAVYGTNPGQNYLRTDVSGNGANDVSNNCFRTSSGTGVYGLGNIQSRNRINYRPGQGIIGRFSAYFSSPPTAPYVSDASGTYQLTGLDNNEDGVYVGYNEGRFGITYNAFGTREVRTLTIAYTSGNATAATITLNGAQTVVSFGGNLTTSKTIAYKISTASFPGWYAEQNGSTVVFIAAESGVKSGSFTATITGGTSTGSFAQTTVGADFGTKVFIPQSEFNGDVLDGTGTSGFTLNPQVGNVFQMNIQYLGFGVITFLIEVTYSNRNKSAFITFHTLKRPNTSIQTTFKNPSLQFSMIAQNNKNSIIQNPVYTYCGSYAGFIEGNRYFQGNRFTYTAVKASVETSFEPLFTILSSHVYNGKSNQSVVNFLNITIGSDSTKMTQFLLVKNCAITGPVDFTQFSPGYSVTWMDTGATGVGSYDNNQIVWSSLTAPNNNILIQFVDDITLQPGETMSCIAKNISGTATSVGVSINTREDQ